VSTGDDADRDARRTAGWWAPLAVAAGAAVAAAVVLGLLAWWSGGAAGPGRLADVGPAPLPVAGIAAATVGLGALVGGYAARLRGRGAGGHGASEPADAAMAGAFDR
jgi:hypothetical protein